MNLNKLWLWLNLAAIFSTLIFSICLKTLIPEQFKSYIDGILLLAVAIFSAGPFIVNYLLLRNTLLPKQKMTYLCSFLLFLLVAVDLFCLFVMYSDQFEMSRGFGLIWCVEIYSILFLPLWVIFLIITTIIKKRISRNATL